VQVDDARLIRARGEPTKGRERGRGSGRIRHPNRKKNRQRRPAVGWSIIRTVIVFVSS